MTITPQTLYLVRGLPGSGKTTLAHQLAPWMFSADDFFMHEGEYRYDPALIRDAHEACQKACWNALVQGKTVAVANTFVRRWEMDAYRAMAKQLPHIRVTEVTVTNPVSDEELAQRCVHGVPVEKIQQMRVRWEQ